LGKSRIRELFEFLGQMPHMKALPTTESLIARFLRYTAIDTQSDPHSPSCPSTEKQKDLGRVLVEELTSIGIADAELDAHGYVYATLPGNSTKEVPVICFCSHMDTSPDCSGANVKAVIHRNYQGGDLVLPADPSIVIRAEEHPALQEQIGQDIITADGTTLLGADNKAGVAAIMHAVHYLLTHPEIKHGDIRILFTPDEEIGRGVNKVDMQKLNARFGYTIDGETLGHIEDETFSADGMEVHFYGVPTHPGFAKNKMVSAIKLAAAFVEALPKEGLSPETTEGREGFVHPVEIKGGIEHAVVSLIVRDFETAKLKDHELLVEDLARKVIAPFAKCSVEIITAEQYRNMKEVLQHHPEVVDYAVEAVKRSGLTPHRGGIRGGTDGSRLSFMGLPCPNIFAGEHAFHSKYEWVSVRDMEKVAETIVHLSSIWEERC
jgi:tripeptide aminopeptidase